MTAHFIRGTKRLHPILRTPVADHVVTCRRHAAVLARHLGYALDR